MTIHLPDDLTSSIQAEVLNGHFASEDDLVASVLRDYLRRRLARSPHTHKPAAGLPTAAKEEPSSQELQRRLFEAGVHQRNQAADHGPDALSEPPGHPDPGRTDLRNRHPRASLTVAVYFLDTSAVVKRYVLETGTAWVQALPLRPLDTSSVLPGSRGPRRSPPSHAGCGAGISPLRMRLRR